MSSLQGQDDQEEVTFHVQLQLPVASGMDYKHKNITIINDASRVMIQVVDDIRGVI
jgi:hypothetical protein